MTAARRAEIAAWRAQGLTMRAVAERLGCSTSWVHQLLARTPHAPEQAAALARFPGFPLRLAATLHARYPDEDALRAAADWELLGLPGMGPARLRQVRQRT